MAIVCARYYVILIGVMSFSIGVFASKSDSSLVAIATAAKSVGTLKNDPQSRKSSYLKSHFSAVATRLSTVCNMTAVTFSGTPSDAGAIVGLANNTNTTFMVMQGNAIIDQVLPGWNGEIVLNLAALSDTTTSPLASFAFVPITGSEQSKLLVRVMTGQQLFTHIQNVKKRESGTTAVSWYKNGGNPLPEAGGMVATGTDLYLVVENETLTTGTPLPAAAKRIQVLNLSNITGMYTVSLSISNMGLALINNQVSAHEQLSSMYAISIQGVHLLNEVQGHTVPLLLMPREVYLAGSGVNTLYAAYMQAYATAISKMYAGTAPVYYDLAIFYTHEPFEYLRLLKYFDLHKSLYAVVDQKAAMSSGQVVGSMILTDVYGAYAQDVSPDLSWVACNQSGLLDATDDYYHVLFSFVSKVPSLSKVGSGSAPTNLKPEQFSFLQDYNDDIYFETLVQNEKLAQAATSHPDQQSPYAYVGYPTTNISAALMDILGNDWYFRMNVQIASSAHWINTDYFAESYLYLGNPTNFTAGQSYNAAGSFPSVWYNLTYAQWKAGIKMVPVFYDTTKCVPYTSMEDFERVNPKAPSSLYLYAYDGTTGEYIGLVGACEGNWARTIATYSQATRYVHLIRNPTFNSSTQQASNYDSFGTAVPGQRGLVGVANCEIEYPGYAYFVKHPKTLNLMAIRNKFPNMLQLNELVKQAWSTQNALAGSWFVTAPIADIQAGIVVQVKSVGSNVYQVTLLDGQNNVLGFQEIHAPDDAKLLVAAPISSAGGLKVYSKEMPLAEKQSYFKLFDTAASGMVMVPVAAPAVTAGASSKVLPKVKAQPNVAVLSKKVVPTSKGDTKLRLENKKLQAQGAALRK